MTTEVSVTELASQIKIALMGISEDDTLPEFQKVCFDKGKLIAEDTNHFHIEVETGLDFTDVAVNGSVLLSFVSTLKGESVFLECSEDHLEVGQGEAYLSIPFMATKEFYTKEKSTKGEGHTIQITESLIEGLAHAIRNVEIKTGNRTREGVMVEVDDGDVYIYATDNESIFEYLVEERIPGASFQNLLPPKFVKSLLVTVKEKNVAGTITFVDNKVVADLSGVIIRSPVKIDEDLELGKTVDDTLGDYSRFLVTVDSLVTESFSRGFVLGSNTLAEITIQRNGIEIHFHSSLGDISENVACKNAWEKESAVIKTVVLNRHLDKTDKIAFLKDALVCEGENFRYVAAYE